jgi:hypothetical protein
MRQIVVSPNGTRRTENRRLLFFYLAFFRLAPAVLRKVLRSGRKETKRARRAKKAKSSFCPALSFLPFCFLFAYVAEPFAMPRAQARFFCRSFVPTSGKRLKLLAPRGGLNVEEPQYPKGFVT